MTSSSKNKNDDDDYEKAFANLDIDSDFNMWTSFRSSIQSSRSGDNNNNSYDDSGGSSNLAFDTTDGEPPLTSSEKIDMTKWDERIKRSDVYRKGYKPNATERKEIDELSRTILGTINNGVGGGMNNMLQLVPRERQTIEKMLRPQQQSSSGGGGGGGGGGGSNKKDADDSTLPVLLKRGPVLWGSSGDGNNSSEGEEVERELILLSNGLIVASVSSTPPPDGGGGATSSGGGRTTTTNNNNGSEGRGNGNGNGSGGGGGKSASAATSGGLAALQPKNLLSTTTNVFNSTTNAFNAAASTTINTGKTMISATTKLIQRSYESCYELKSIEAVMDLGLCTKPSLQLDAKYDSDEDDDEEEYNDYHPTSIQIVFRGGGGGGGGGGGLGGSIANIGIGGGNKNNADSSQQLSSHRVTFSSRAQKEAWIRALIPSVVGAYKRAYGHGGKGGGNEIGWTHRLMRTTYYSAAVCGDADMLQTILRASKRGTANVADSSGYAPIHYAAMNGHNSCLAVLLDAGADANLKDVKKATAVDYASQRRNRRGLEMLLANGGKLTSADREWLQKETMSSYSTGGGGSTAAGAGGQMSENMSHLQERGEKLRNVNAKAADLKDGAANYKDMASQMKKKAQEQDSKIFGIF